MKLNFLLLPMLALCVACGSTPENKSAKSDNDSLKLVWGDEFDYTGLPDSTKWGYEEGFVRNQEAQYFTKARIENAEVKDGLLHINALKEKFEGAEYTSASLITKGKYDFTYGRIEISAKVPEGKGVWAALWTLGSTFDETPWPLCGEIDILEFVGHDPSSVHFNMHTEKYNHAMKTNIGHIHTVQNPWGDFHIYAVEWTEDSLTWFFDDKAIFTANKKEGDDVKGWPFTDASQYLIMNLAIGGTWGGEQGIDDSKFPQTFEIDYVRIYDINK